EIEYRTTHVLYAAHCLSYLPGQYLFRRLPVGVPRRRVRPPHRDQGEAPELNEPAFGEVHVRRFIERSIDRERVIIPAIHDAGDIGLPELVIRDIQPSVQRSHDLLVKAPSDDAVIS